MYIPRLEPQPPEAAADNPPDLGRHGQPNTPLSAALHGLFRDADSSQRFPSLAKRGPVDTNTTIGIIVGVLLGVFLIATCAFLWRYRYTVRFSRRRRHRRRRKSGGSKSSKSSHGSAPASPAGDAPQPPPPAAK